MEPCTNLVRQVGAWHQVALTDHSWRPRRAIDEPRPLAHPQKAYAIARIIKHRLCLVVGERVELRDGRLADRCEVHHRAHLTDDGKVDRQSTPRFRHPAARAMAALNTAIGETAAGDAKAELAALDAMNSVLGVFERNEALASAANDDLAAKVEVLLERRKAARVAKDWAESDRVRDELTALGVRIKDGPQGTTWERAV